MKKLITLLALIPACMVTMAQRPNFSQYEVPRYPAERIEDAAETPVNLIQRDGGDILWSSDFTDESVWTIDNSGGDFGWEITTSENGWFFNGNINSTSDGEYAFVWNDDPFVNTSIPYAEYYMTTAEAIDISEYTSGILEFELYGARFTDSLIVELSTDGENFFKLTDHQDLSQLTAFSGSIFANPTIRRFNITNLVAANDQLWVRFKWNGEIGYGFFIDDVKLIEPVDYDIEIMEVWTGDILFDYEYTMIPVAQLAPQIIGASFRNMGGKTATNVRFNAMYTPEGGSVEFDDESESVTMEPGDYDTIWWVTPFIPGALVDTEYGVDFLMLMDSLDACPDDNMLSKNMMVTESIWANDRYDDLNLSFDGELGSATNADDFLVGSAFQVANPDTDFELIHFRVAPGTALPQLVTFELWQLDLENFEFYPLSYTEYELGSVDLSGTSSLASDDPFPLEEGETYVLTIGHISGEPLIVRGSEGDNDFSTFLYGPYSSTGDPSWFTFSDYSPAVRLGLDASIGVPELSSEQIADMLNQNYPNPFGGSSTVSFRVHTPGQVKLELRTATGQLVRTIDKGALPAGNHTIQLDAANLSSGVYEYTLVTPDGSTTKKLVVQK